MVEEGKKAIKEQRMKERTAVLAQKVVINEDANLKSI